MKKNLMFIFLIIIFCFSLPGKEFQNDTYYSIAIGEHILENGIDLSYDPFSWHKDLPYTYPHWLNDIIIYLSYLVCNLNGVFLLTCGLSALLGTILYIVNVKLTNNKIVSFFVTIGIMYAMRDYLAARAQLSTYVLFILEIYFIESFMKTKNKKYGIGLFIISVLIANVHVAVWPFFFVLFLPYFAEYIVAKFITKKDKEIFYGKIDIHKVDSVKILFIIMLTCILGGFCTPLADTPFTYLIKTYMGNTTKNINEHLPLTLVYNVNLLIILSVILVILINPKTKIRLSDTFMLGGLIFMTFASRRQESMFLLIGSVIMNRLICSSIKEYKENGVEILENLAQNKIFSIVVSVGLIGISVYFVISQSKIQYVNESKYPVEACNYILENLDIVNMRLYNDYDYGSYILYRNIPVFIDSRADLYAPEFNTPTGKKEDGRDIFSDYIETSALNTYYGDTFKKYGITHVMLKTNSKMNLMIKKTNDGEYNCIYSDKNFVLYEISFR